MNEKKLNEILKSINYPKLDKNIVDLQIIHKAKIKGNSIDIVLNTQNNSAFSIIANEISKKLKNFTKNLHVSKLSEEKKSVNYGHTDNPNNRAPYAKNIIAVTSGKGGVGKSTVSSNISVALAQEGFKVGLLDADIYGPNIPRMFNIEDEKLIWNENNKIIPNENFGIKIMSVGLTTPSKDTPLVWRSSVAISALIQFLEDVEWGKLDFLVIDMPPGTGDVQLTMAQELPITKSILVTTPQNIATDDVSRAIMMFKETNVPIAGVIENMSYFIAPDTQKRYDIFGKDGGEKLCQKYNLDFLGKIPIDMQIREFSDEGKIVVALGNENQKRYYKEIIKKITM